MVNWLMNANISQEGKKMSKFPEWTLLSVSGKLNVSKDAPVVPQYLTHPGFMMPFFIIILESIVMPM